MTDDVPDFVWVEFRDQLVDIALWSNVLGGTPYIRNTPDALVKSTEVQALIAAAVMEAADAVDTCGDSAVTEALGQQLCCSGHHCGCRGADVGTLLRHEILALIPADAKAALEAYRDREVAKALARAASVAENACLVYPDGGKSD